MATASRKSQTEKAGRGMKSQKSSYRFRGSVEPQRGTRASVLEVAPGGEAVSVLRLYDPIDSWGGDWGVSAKEFAAALAAVPKETTEIQLHINSPGGEVFEAIAILNQLRQHKAKVVAYVDGIAASAASVIASGADEMIMGRNTTLMVHDAWGLEMGNASAMHSYGDVLDKLSDNLASVYAAKAEGSVEAWREIMRAETWMTAAEAMEAGLADRIDEKQESAAARFDLTIFSYAGRADAPAPQFPSAPVASVDDKPPAEPEEPPTPHKKGPATMTDLNKGLREQLGIPAEAQLDDDGILAALAEALAEQEPAPTPATPAASAAGTVNLDEAQYQDLIAAAADGRAARQQQLTDARTALVDAAINDGRIAPARRDNWVTALAADPGAEETLAGLAPGLVVNVKPSGYTGGIDEAKDEDTIYSRVWSDTPKES